MVRAIFPGLFTLSFTALAAHAAPATQAEADRLTAVFERYVGHPASGAPANLTVRPDGDDYRVEFDIKRALQALSTSNVTIEDAVAAMRITPQANGTWHVTSEPLPTLVIHSGPQTMRLQYSNYKFEGTFDPAIAAFSDGTTSVENSVVDQQTATVTQHQRFDKVTGIQHAEPAGPAATTMDAHYTIAGLSVDGVLTPPPPAAPAGEDAPPPVSKPVSYSYQVPSTVADISIAKLHMKDLLEIWAFFVAHPDHDSIVAAQEDLRGLLRGALPYLDGLAEKVALDQFALTTPVGPFAARRIASELELADLPATGKATLGLTFDGLTVPTGDLPPWSLGLIPNFVDVKTAVSGFHAVDAARQAIDGFDLKGDGFTEEQRQTILQTAWPPTGGRIVLAPSRLTSSLLDLRLDGEAELSGGMPSGRLSVTGTGLDKVITMLQGAAVSDPNAAQVLSQFVVAKNLAKPGPDGSLTWVLQASGNGPVTVNDTPLK